MKKTTLILFVSLALFACKKETPTEPTVEVQSTVINFDDAKLDTAGVMDKTPYVSGDISLSNNYDTTYYYWEGFAISNHTDSIDGAPANQYSVVTGNAHSGDKFAVAYAGFAIPTQIASAKDIKPKRLFITNSTYVYKTILNGNAYCRKFTTDDYYTVTFTGISANNDTTGTVIVYLADYRDGKTEVVNTWKEVDLTPLGTCRTINLTFNSTDTGEYGINTPCYAVIDDFEYNY